MFPRIVVVIGDGERRKVLLDTLSGAGYLACGASTFAEGRQLIERESTDLVIADQRLGAFNGLHLLVVGRARHPRMRGIVTSREQDRALDNEARGLDAQSVGHATAPAAWLASVTRCLAQA